MWSNDEISLSVSPFVRMTRPRKYDKICIDQLGIHKVIVLVAQNLHDALRLKIECQSCDVSNAAQLPAAARCVNAKASARVSARLCMTSHQLLLSVCLLVWLEFGKIRSLENEKYSIRHKFKVKRAAQIQCNLNSCLRLQHRTCRRRHQGPQWNPQSSSQFDYNQSNIPSD